MADPRQSDHRDISAPVRFHFAITADDDADMAIRPTVIKILTAGNIALRDEAGTDITYAVAAGDLLQISAVRVLETGTTATMVGWY
jgi:hypothetical protein